MMDCRPKTDSFFSGANKTWRNVLTKMIRQWYDRNTNKTWQKRGMVMNKEEILQKSRNENQNRDIYEIEVINKAQRIGGLTALFVTLALMVIERLLFDITDYGYFLIIESAVMGLWIYKAVKMRKRHEILLAFFWTALVIYAAVMVVLDFIG